MWKWPIKNETQKKQGKRLVWMGKKNGYPVRVKREGSSSPLLALVPKQKLSSLGLSYLSVCCFSLETNAQVND